jgi:hypothetical protein
VNAQFRLDATSWSPVDTVIVDDSSNAGKPRRGPSLVFAIAVIGGVALATAGVVGVFFVEPSQGAPDAQPVIAAEAPIETASLDPTFLPVRKVVVQHIKVKQPPEVEQRPEPQVTTEAAADVDALAPLNPRWARATLPSPGVAASVAATIPPVTATEPAAANDRSTDGTETAAIDPDEAAPLAVAKTSEPKATAGEDDPISLVARSRPAQVSTAANMRSRPKSGSSVIMVVPQSATVQLVGCKVWCEIVYKGRRGYVYKDFLGGGRTASASGKVKSSSASKPTAVKTADTEPDAQGLPGVETQAIKPLSTRLQ